LVAFAVPHIAIPVSIMLLQTCFRYLSLEAMEVLISRLELFRELAVPLWFPKTKSLVRNMHQVCRWTMP